MSETDQLALYRLWRPQTFSEVVAQEQIVYPLRQSVINGNFSHALLFSGTRGTGKTSLAKIFAKAINCLNPERGDPCNECEICLAANDGSLMDISEIDAASHNSVDHMRRLTDEVAFTPLKARFKVYIIDEVHMLSVGAFNALLKTLEEPPSHAVFVMATTEPHRIPATIISRCQHFKFRRIPNDEIIERVRLIAKSIDLAVDESAFEMIATLSAGALRDAIGLLDQTRQLETTPITRDDVLTLAGLVPDRFLSETAEAILFKKPDVLLVNIQELVMSGRDLTRFVTDLGAYFRNLLVASVSKKPEQLIQLRGEDIERMASIAKQTETTVLTELIAGLSQLLVSMRLSPDLRTTLEIGLIGLLTRFGNEIDIKIADRSRDCRIQKASEDAQKTDSPQAKPIPATEKPSGTVVETNVDAEPYQSGEPVVEDSTRTESKIVSENDLQPAEKRKDVNPPSESDGQSSDTIFTAMGEMPVLDIWRAVLDDLQRERRMDIALCARPARIKTDGKKIALHFDARLKGQHSLLSQIDNTRMVQQLISNHVGYKVELRIILDKMHDSMEGNSAEWGWLKQAREQALIEDIPSPIGENE
ncbi:MAG: DNA polymerase III subunit gamma/tau [Saccharofermentanales bacterium]